MGPSSSRVRRSVFTSSENVKNPMDTNADLRKKRIMANENHAARYIVVDEFKCLSSNNSLLIFDVDFDSQGFSVFIY
jgi:hypothetical protein